MAKQANHTPPEPNAYEEVDPRTRKPSVAVHGMRDAEANPVVGRPVGTEVMEYPNRSQAYGRVTPGRIVHMHDGATLHDARQGTIAMCRGMMVTRAWSGEVVNGTVFTDWTNDMVEGMAGARGLVWATSVQYHPDPRKVEWRTWHWPQDCPFE